MGCCGGTSARLKSPPKREPYVVCGGRDRVFAPGAWVMVQRFGLDPCSVAGTGQDGLVTRFDVERARLAR